jgi:hypothetical protein
VTKVERRNIDEPNQVITHVHMEVPQETFSVAILNKQKFQFFSLLQLENRRSEQVLPGG